MTTSNIIINGGSPKKRYTGYTVRQARREQQGYRLQKLRKGTLRTTDSEWEQGERRKKGQATSGKPVPDDKYRGSVWGA